MKRRGVEELKEVVEGTNDEKNGENDNGEENTETQVQVETSEVVQKRIVPVAENVDVQHSHTEEEQAKHSSSSSQQQCKSPKKMNLPKPLKERQRKMIRLLYKEKEKDLSDNLDYIISLGSQINYMKFVQDKWMESNPNLLPSCTKINTATARIKTTNSTTQTNDYLTHIASRLHDFQSSIPRFIKQQIEYLVHAEDAVLYSNLQHVNQYHAKERQQQRKPKTIQPNIATQPLFKWPIKDIHRSIGKAEEELDRFNSSSKDDQINDKYHREGYKKRKLNEMNGGKAVVREEYDIDPHSARLDNWDMEYGDNIPYQNLQRKINFYHSANSVNSQNQYKDIGDDNDDDISTGKITDNHWKNQYEDESSDELEQSNSQKLVLNEMLDRAWERAIHVASATIACPLVHTVPSVPASNKTPSKIINPAKSSSSSLGAIVVNDIDNDTKQNDQHMKSNDDDDNTNDIDKDDMNNNEEHSETKRELEEIMSRISSHQIQAVIKCKALDITFDPIKVFERHVKKNGENDKHNYDMDDADDNSNSKQLFYKCQSCNQTLRYKSNEDTLKHLYGTDERNGCCWKLIHLKHIKIIKSIVEKEGIHTIDGLLHVLFQNTSSRRLKGEDKSVDGSTASAMNWMDVMTSMKEELNKRSYNWSNSVSSHNHNNNSISSNSGNITGKSDHHRCGKLSCQGEDYTKRITVHDDILPIALNKDVLELVTRHLVHRYGVCGDHDFSNP